MVASLLFAPRLATAVTLGLVLCGFVAPAQAKGTDPHQLTIPLVEFIQCSTCHSFANPDDRSSEPPFAPIAWLGSMMGNSSRDPVFWAAVSIAKQDYPDETQLCVRCHAPRAFLQGHGDATRYADLPNDLNEGVGCDLCHRMLDNPGEKPGNANYLIDDGSVDKPPPKSGPWAYTDVGKLMHGYDDQNPIVATSRLCGTCHDVTTDRPAVDDAGNELGHGFAEQRTFSEWRDSSFSGKGGKSCQDCHMPAVANVAGCKDFLLPELLHASGGRRHDLVGANVPMLEVLREIYGSSGSNEVPDRYFDNSIALTRELLGKAATLELSSAAAVDLTAPVEVQHKLTNKSGHKLPTGYSEGRVMWVETTFSFQGTVVDTIGAWSTEHGIENDTRARKYQAVAEDASDQTIFHLLRNSRWREDSRVPPLGLKRNSETDPVGDRYQLQADNTWPNFDSFSYISDLSHLRDATPEDASDNLLSVQSRILYAINTPDYLRFLEQANTSNDNGKALLAAVQAHGGLAPVELAVTSTKIEIARFSDDSATTSGDGTSTDTTHETSSQTTDTPTQSQVSQDSDDAGSGGSGCGCRAGRGQVGAWSTAIGLLFFASAKRRRKK